MKSSRRPRQFPYGSTLLARGFAEELPRLVEAMAVRAVMAAWAQC
ncbi:hypothetical protein [Nitrosovibrio tenuis]|nr:hypothetical protein [Nitrosovibrio tenuis]